MTHFLELSRGRQFDSVLSSHFDRYLFRDQVSLILGLLVAESARWRHVTLDVRTCDIRVPELDQVKDRLPSMQSLRLICIPCFFNWSSLTHICLNFMTCEVDHLHSTILCLQQAINLNTLITPGIAPDSFNISERITLPRLESWQVWLRCRIFVYMETVPSKSMSSSHRFYASQGVSYLCEPLKFCGMPQSSSI